MTDDDEEVVVEKVRTGFTPVGFTAGVEHLLAQSSPNCPKCGSKPSEHEVRNYTIITQSGDVHCKPCGAYVRDYDAS